MNEDVIKIKEGKMPEALRALYNRATWFGNGDLAYTPEKMSINEARHIIAEGYEGFDYMRGRLLKISIHTGGLIWVWRYDMQYGYHAAANECLEWMERMDEPVEIMSRAEEHECKVWDTVTYHS